MPKALTRKTGTAIKSSAISLTTQNYWKNDNMALKGIIRPIEPFSMFRLTIPSLMHQKTRFGAVSAFLRLSVRRSALASISFTGIIRKDFLHRRGRYRMKISSICSPKCLLYHLYQFFSNSPIGDFFTREISRITS